MQIQHNGQYTKLKRKTKIEIIQFTQNHIE